MNTTCVDKYIDKYWMLKCPDRLSVSEVNQQVYMLFHQMFILGNEYQTRMTAKMEKEKTQQKKQSRGFAMQEECQKFKHRGMKFVKSSMVNEIEGKTYLHRRMKSSQQHHRRYKSTEWVQFDYSDYHGQRGSTGHKPFYSPRGPTPVRTRHRQRPQSLGDYYFSETNLHAGDKHLRHPPIDCARSNQSHLRSPNSLDFRNHPEDEESMSNVS